MNARPKRRWYQVRLSSLLALMLVAACGAWFVGQRRQRVEFERRQGEAIVELSRWAGDPAVSADAVELNLYSGINPDVLHHAAYLPRLKRLSIGGTEYDASHMQVLARLPRLRALEIRNASLTPAAFEELGALGRLEELNLLGTPVNTAALEQVGQLRRLQALIVETPQDRAAWQHLGQLKRLKSLRIMKGYRLQPGDLRFLAQMPELRLFWLQSSIEGDVLADLKHVPQLTELRLQANQLQDRDLQYIAGHRRLRHLTLESNSGNYVTDEGLAVVARFRELSFLNVSRCRGVTDRGLAHVRNLAYLRTLRLSGTNITDQGLQHLSGLQRLVNLHVETTSVTPQGLKRLGPRPELKTLKVNGVEPAVVAELRLQFAQAEFE